MKIAMEKTFLLHLSARWGDLIEQIKTNLSYTLKALYQIKVKLSQYNILQQEKKVMFTQDN